VNRNEMHARKRIAHRRTAGHDLVVTFEALQIGAQLSALYMRTSGQRGDPLHDVHVASCGREDVTKCSPKL
jgi:hypothetical protein